ncbi:MAG: hypothetical protein PHQ43_07565 [Dehalococcoidales bacterium]|nr:hypothetical protein [Dehalococcoidales bacterium]
MAADRIEIDLSTMVFVGVCGDGALFMDGDGDEILFRTGGNKHDLAAAACELRRAAKELEALCKWST